MPVVTGEELYTKARVPRGLRAARRRHHQPRRLQRAAASRSSADRRDGRGVPRGGLAPQLQQHHRRPGRHACTSRAAMPNFLITEYFVNFEPRGAEVAVDRSASRVAISRCRAAPGLGIELARTSSRAMRIASSRRATSPRRGTRGRRRGNFLPAVVVTVVTAPTNWHGDEHATGQRGAHHGREQHRHEDASPPKHILHRQPPERPDRALLIDVGASVAIPAPTGRAGSQAADFWRHSRICVCAPGSGRCRRRRGAPGRPRPP